MSEPLHHHHDVSRSEPAGAGLRGDVSEEARGRVTRGLETTATGTSGTAFGKQASQSP